MSAHNVWYILLIVIVNYMQLLKCSEERQRPPQHPNIIVIIADDMGFNDVGSHGAQHIPTPNIDALGVFGVQLNRYYTAPVCTPSRASFMTGKYASKLGMQHYAMSSDQPYGLELSEKLLPQYMQDAGYSTQMIGKWHLGHYRKVYTPTYRGFDSFLGFYSGVVDYWDYHYNVRSLPLSPGYDMRKNMSVYWESNGIYATDLFTNYAVNTIINYNQQKPLFLYLAYSAPHSVEGPETLQVPDDDLKEFEFITNIERRRYAAMVSHMDKGIGRIIRALKEKDMLNNSIVLFFCDNGAPTQGELSNSGSNKPFRGQKDSPWEGSSHSAGFIWSPLIESPQRVSNQLIHITDWLPTFARLAGIEIASKENLDGMDVWDAISKNVASPRNEVLINFDSEFNYSSFINGSFKWVEGNRFAGQHDGWLGDIDETEQHSDFKNYATIITSSDAGQALGAYSIRNPLTVDKINQHLNDAKITCNGYNSSNILPILQCYPALYPCIFNIIDDPCETTNLAHTRLDVLSIFTARASYFKSVEVTPRNKPSDYRADPAQFNNTWTWWYDELGINAGSTIINLSFITSLCISAIISYFH